MPARWLMFATLSLGFGLGIAGATSWTQSPTKSYVLPQPTPAAPMVLTVVVERQITAAPTSTATLKPWALTATALLSATRAPMVPTPTATPVFRTNHPTDAEVTTR